MGLKDLFERKKVKFDLPLGLIQNIRFALALAEKNSEIAVPYKYKFIFDYLYKKFQIPVKTYRKQEFGIKKTSLSFSHEKPEIRINDICMPLVFPVAMVNFCEANWKNANRKIIFSGLITDKRKESLENWLEYICKYKVDIKDSFKNEKIEISFSSRGRELPVKAWDQEYYDKLLENQFALCPDGDFIWTYRFFEAVMCGAIPIIENTCSLYTNFKCYDMKTPLDEIVYDQEMVNHNIKYFKKNYTFSDIDI